MVVKQYDVIYVSSFSTVQCFCCVVVVLFIIICVILVVIQHNVCCVCGCNTVQGYFCVRL